MDKFEQLPALTGIRGVAALMVVLGHYKNYTAVDLPIISMSYMSVDLFFILSGFILAHVHLRDFQTPTFRGTMRFLLLRLGRIYPVHLFTLLAVLSFYLGTMALGKDWSGATRFTPGAFVGSLFLVQSWGWAASDSWNILSWSISTEWAAYLAFPLLALGVLRVRSAAVAATLAGVVLAGMVVVLISLGQETTGTTFRYGLIRVAGGFTCGMLLYAVYRLPVFSGVRWGLVSIGCVLILAIQLWAGQSFAALPTLGLLVLAVASGQGSIARLLSTRPILYLGEVSYSLYMVHMIAMEIALAPISFSDIELRYAWATAACYIASVIAIILATLLTYYGVERPARNWCRARLGRGVGGLSAVRVST